MLSTDIMQCLCEIYHLTKKRLVQTEGSSRTILCRSTGTCNVFNYDHLFVLLFLWLIKVHMKVNQYFNILKVQHFKDLIPKFEPCLKKIGNFITLESCAILLLKVVFESRGQNVLSRSLMT